MSNTTVLVSVSLLGSALTTVGVTAYLAWNSLSGRSELQNTTPQPIAQSQPALLTPVASAQVAQVAQVAQPALQPQLTQLQPEQPIVNVATATLTTSSLTANWSQAENDYLYDLTQALQPVERDRLSQTEQVEMARQIQQWMLAGMNQQSLLQQFDAAYGNSIVGDYFYNRDVYLQITSTYFAPDYRFLPPTNQAPTPFQQSPFQQMPGPLLPRDPAAGQLTDAPTYP